MERTAQKGGLKGSGGEEPPMSPPPDKKRAATVQPKTGDAEKLDTSKRLSRNDLRPQISHDSELAHAVAQVIGNLDPVAQQYVKPATMLRRFLEQNDAVLAKMFKESHAGS